MEKKFYTSLDAIAPPAGSTVGKATVEELHEEKPTPKKKIKGKVFLEKLGLDKLPTL
jgi:hypothetical protein